MSGIKVLFGVSPNELREHLQRHTALYKPRRKPKDFIVDIFAGQHCSAIWSNTFDCPELFLMPIGHQLSVIWMDVRYVDGDSWEFSCYTDFTQELTHNVNPWVMRPEFRYDARAEKGVQHRIKKICKLLPHFAEAIPPYMLLWRYPEDVSRPEKLIDRVGKARDSDEFEYGDAYQYCDFLNCFGIDLEEPLHQVKLHL